jgi:hypothetical protein
MDEVLSSSLLCLGSVAWYIMPHRNRRRLSADVALFPMSSRNTYIELLTKKKGNIH